MMSEFEQRRLAHHEAGHLVAAWREGFEPGSLTISWNRSGNASVGVACRAADPAEYARRRIRVLLAGAVAQCALLSPGNYECTKSAFCSRGDSADDWDKALELAWLVRNIRVGDDSDPAREVEGILNGLLQETVRLIQGEAERVRRVAGRAFQEYLHLAKVDPGDMAAETSVTLGPEEVLALILG